MAKRIRDKDETRMIHVRLRPELHKRVRVHVAELDTSIQDWLVTLIEKELDSRTKVKS